MGKYGLGMVLDDTEMLIPSNLELHNEVDKILILHTLLTTTNFSLRDMEVRGRC